MPAGGAFNHARARKDELVETEVFECKQCGAWKREEYSLDGMCCGKKMKKGKRMLKPVITGSELFDISPGKMVYIGH